VLSDIPLFGGGATPGVRRPVFEIAFGGGGDAGGGLLSAAASAIGLGGGGGDPWQRSVARMTLDIGVAPDVDVAEITLSADSQAPGIALADAGTIALGYEDAGATAVYAGAIESIRRAARGSTRIVIANGSSRLAGLRVQQSFEDQSAGQVVKELASQAEVTAGDIADGTDLSFIVLDGGRSAWEHIAQLSRLCGHLARVNAAGELDFTPPDDGEPAQAFAWGADVLGLERTETPASFDTVTVSGEGAAGSQGKDAWNWLIKQPAPVTGSAGAGAKARAFSERALRSADAVRAAAQALADAAARASMTGTVLVPGAPAVAPGLRIKLQGTPGGAFDGDFLVTRVRHTYDKRSGFRSRITFTASGGGSSALGGLL
jgi:phage protein D